MSAPPQNTKERVKAAQALLLSTEISLGQVAHIRTLVQGISPRLDVLLSQCAEHISTIEHIREGDMISLAAGNLPENTEEEKKRKKKIILFVGTWNTLKSEVARVEEELASDTSPSRWQRVFHGAKGPLGVLTIAAVGIVITMQALAVEVVIRNDGCDTFIPEVSLPFALPGLSLPKEPIPSGSSASATVPGLTFTVDGTQQNILRAQILNYSLNFVLTDDLADLRLDSESLIGIKKQIDLGTAKKHTLTFICNG